MVAESRAGNESTSLETKASNRISRGSGIGRVAQSLGRLFRDQVSQRSFVGHQNVASGKALTTTLHQRALSKLSSATITPAIKYLVKVVPDVHGVSRGPSTVALIAKRNVDGLSGHPSLITSAHPKYKGALGRCYLIPRFSMGRGGP
jgi:hypothetical protein